MQPKSGARSCLDIENEMSFSDQRSSKKKASRECEKNERLTTVGAEVANRMEVLNSIFEHAPLFLLAH